MKGVKVLKWVGLGLVFWSLSLLWPEINLLLTPPVIVGLVLLLATMILAYTLGYYHSHNNQSNQPDRSKQNHSSRPSRPVPPLSMA